MTPLSFWKEKKESEQSISFKTPQKTPSAPPKIESKPITPSVTATASKSNTIIGVGTTIVGTLKSEGSVEILGNFEGEIEVRENLQIGPEAIVKANLKGGNIKIGGKVIGNVIAKEKTEILSTGKLLGDITTPRLVIADGVFFEGRCSMGKKDSELTEIKEKDAEIKKNEKEIKNTLV